MKGLAATSGLKILFLFEGTFGCHKLRRSIAALKQSCAVASRASRSLALAPPPGVGESAFDAENPDGDVGNAVQHELAEVVEPIKTILKALRMFRLQVRQIHYDVTSVELYGAYAR